MQGFTPDATPIRAGGGPRGSGYPWEGAGTGIWGGVGNIVCSTSLFYVTGMNKECWDIVIPPKSPL